MMKTKGILLLCVAMAGTVKPALATPFFEFTIIGAEEGTGPGGGVMTGVEPNVSVNEEGDVAFIAALPTGSPAQPMQQLLVGSGPGTLENISLSPSARNFDFPQINNAGRVVTRELAGGNSVVRVWDARNPGAFDLISTTTTTPFSQLTLPSLGHSGIGNPPLISFLGRIADLTFGLWANDTLNFNQQDAVSPLTGTMLSSFRSAVSGAQRIIVAQYTGDNSSPAASVRRIVAFEDVGNNGLWSETLVASTASGEPWLDLGASPGISDTGEFIAFAGDHAQNGRGIYVAFSSNGFTSAPTILYAITTASLIACDENGHPITMADFNFDNRIGVLHQRLGAAGLDGDVVTLAFIATPKRASMPNSALSNRPLVFSANEGLWTMRVDFESDLNSASTSPRIHSAQPIPVVQAGDIVDGDTVESVVLWDPLAVPWRDTAGNPRVDRPADHYVAFSVNTADGVKVVRGAHMDTDTDGLPDHWERSGIDVDGDGTAELDLPALGADVMRADIFLEIDWLNDRTAGAAVPYSCRPAPWMAAWLEQMYADAPRLNPDGSTGITLHVDAGPRYDEMGEPYSLNMGIEPGVLDGGQVISEGENADGHVDHVFMGWPDEAPRIEGLVSRSLFELKNRYFGKKDLRAREFAFKYAVLADFHTVLSSNTGSGEAFYIGRVGSAGPGFLVPAANSPSPPDFSQSAGALKIVQGRGAGQVRMLGEGSTPTMISVREPWSVVPDTSSLYVLFHGSSGTSEVYFWDNASAHARPGNDVLLNLGSSWVNSGGWLADVHAQWRTLAHELGHTFGLRHGGNNHVHRKPNYLSIMNYRFQLNAASGVNSYSGSGDAVFNDWGYLKQDFFRSGIMIGSTSPACPLVRFTMEPEVPDPPPVIDPRPPTVVITAPAPVAGCSFTVAPGATLNVTAVASDDRELKSVLLLFDRNGDGDTLDADEAVAPVFVPGPGHYAASFAGVSGPAGTRHVIALAFDASGNMGRFATPVSAGSNAAGVQTLASRSANFTAQAASGQRQKTVFTGIAVPGSGKVLFSVTGTPPNRQAGATGPQRHDAVVERIVFRGQDVLLLPACNPPGCSPSVCTSYWQAPAAGATLDVEVLGPANYDAAGAFLGAPAQAVSLTVTYEAVDLTPPQVQIVSPAADAFIETGEALQVTVNATDDFGIARVDVALDVNGDGDDADGGEKLQASSPGGDAWRASFAALGGGAGTRTLKVTATDTAGLAKTLTVFIRVQLPDTSPPAVVITAPAAGWPVKQGDSLAVQVSAFDDIEMDQVEVQLDLNGDGDTTDSGETAIAPRSGINVFAHTFGALTGATGSRTLLATARDKAQNTSQASRPVTVISATPTPQTLLTDANHTIPASPGQFNGGFQRVVEYTPITLPRSGFVTFKVTSSPNVRQATQNVPRADPFVNKVWLNGVERVLSPSCNAFGSNPAICETSFEAPAGGSLDFQVLGPGTWNIWGEFDGTPAVVYTLEVTFVSTDHTLPVITVTSPALGANQPLNQPLIANMTVSDDVQVASVTAGFDVNGDGDQDDLGEQVAAANLGGNNYRAAFGNVTGSPGNRAIVILATDTAFNTMRREHSVGVDGAGTGETIVKTQSGVIPGQPAAVNGGSRQIVPVTGIAIPGPGRVVIRVVSLPNMRQAVTNLERYDAEVRRIVFNGQAINLAPVCNPPGSNPAICVSTWDAPSAGMMDLEIRGPAEFNIWGEFTGTGNQSYQLEVAFLPGPSVASVTPNTGSVAGHETVTVRGTGFAARTLVLFGDVAATEVQRISGTEIRCSTPPGVNGAVTLTVLNADDGTAAHSWNYGSPYGLFGRLTNGFTYLTPAQQPVSSLGERLIGTWRGNFAAVGPDQPQQTSSQTVNVPGPGQVRFEIYAFVPVLNPVPGPFEDPTDLLWGNTSSSVTSFRDATNTARPLTTTFTDISHPWGPVIANSTATVPAAGAGNAGFTIHGPARWNAFWRDFGDFVMSGAPAQTWVVAAWHVNPHSVTSVTPAQGPVEGNTPVTIKGANFASPATVYFGQHLATSVAFVDANTITCRTPAVFGADVVDVTVFKDGRSAVLRSAFRYVEGNDFCVPIPGGLVSWWPGDPGATDLKGPNEGILKGGAVTGPGYAGQGFVLDGVDDYIETPVAGLGIGPGDFTIDGWVKSTSTDAYNALVSFDSFAPALYMINADGALRLYPAGASAVNGFNDGQWHHFAAVRRNGTVTYYKDGNPGGATNYPNAINPAKFYIGSSTWGGENLPGSIDEVDFFNRALTEEEIRLLFLGGSAGKCRHDADNDGMLDAWELVYGLNPASAADAMADADGDGLSNRMEHDLNIAPNDADTDDDTASDGYELSAGSDPANGQSIPPYLNALGLLAWWDFNDNSAPARSNDRVHNFRGDLAGGATFSVPGGGRSGGASDYSLDATRAQSDRLSVEDARWLNAAGAIDKVTFSFWQKTMAVTTAASFHAVSPSSEDARGASVHLPWTDNTISWDTGGWSSTATQRIQVTSPATLNHSQWHHFAFVKNIDTKEIWVDGQMIHSGANTRDLARDMIRLTVGSYDPPYGGWQAQAFIDDFAVYADALTGAQIQRLAAGTTPDAILTAGPALTVFPALMDFGPVAAGQSIERTIVLRNTGDAAATVNSLSLTGTAFAIVNAAPPFAIAPGAARPVAIRFTPPAHGVSTASLTIGGTAITAGLMGTGLDPASPNALLAWWNFDDAANTAGSSDAIHGFAGTWVAGGKHSAAAGGRTAASADRAADFTASGLDRLEVANAGWFRAASAVDKVTISFWQKNTAVTDSASFHFWSPAMEDRRGAYAHCPWSDGRIYWDTGGYSNTATVRISGNPPAGHNYNLWHHYAFVKNGTAKEIWVDGTRIANGTNTLPLANDIDLLHIGAGGLAYAVQAFIDDFAVFSGALNAAQIQQLATGTRPDNILTTPPAGSGFRITGATINPASRAVTLTWVSQPGAVYIVQRSTNLTTWETVQSGVASGGATTTFVTPASAQAKLFFRVKTGP